MDLPPCDMSGGPLRRAENHRGNVARAVDCLSPKRARVLLRDEVAFFFSGRQCRSMDMRCVAKHRLETIFFSFPLNVGRDVGRDFGRRLSSKMESRHDRKGLLIAESRKGRGSIRLLLGTTWELGKHIPNHRARERRQSHSTELPPGSRHSRRFIVSPDRDSCRVTMRWLQRQSMNKARRSPDPKSLW